MKRVAILALGLVSLIPLSTWALGSAFVSDLEGWTLVDKDGSFAEGELVWRDVGGNPDGFVEFTDEGSDGGFISAPAEYLGNWTNYDGVLIISYDHIIISEGSVTERLPYEIRISGPGGEAQFLGDTPAPPSGWCPVVTPLDSDKWTILDGDWLSVLANVSSFRIRIEVTSGFFDVSGIDNIELSAYTAAVGPWTGANQFNITQIRPNPFSGETKLAFVNNLSRDLVLDVFDLRGRRIVSQRPGTGAEGSGAISFNGKDDRGIKLAAGQYVVRLTNGRTSAFGEFTVVR